MLNIGEGEFQILDLSNAKDCVPSSETEEPSGRRGPLAHQNLPPPMSDFCIQRRHPALQEVLCKRRIGRHAKGIGPSERF